MQSLLLSTKNTHRESLNGMNTGLLPWQQAKKDFSAVHLSTPTWKTVARADKQSACSVVAVVERARLHVGG